MTTENSNFILSATDVLIDENLKKKLQDILENHNKSKTQETKQEDITIITKIYKSEERCPLCINSKFRHTKIYNISKKNINITLSEIDLHMLLEHTNKLYSSSNF
jgi:hypothetical protein